MACYHPLQAYQPYSGGAVRWHDDGSGKAITLPCGKCIGCRRGHSTAWAIRCVHESRMHQHNAFATLTYDNEHYKPGLEYRDVQLFLKRLRKAKGPFRYFIAGEYGDISKRPHWHALLFGIKLDRKRYSKTLYEDRTLTETWQQGQVLYGEVTPQSAAYCAKYSMKRKTGGMQEGYYTHTDERTGQPVRVQPEMAAMSRRPGIGSEWIRKHWRDVYSSYDKVLHNKRLLTPPKMYDKFLEEQDPELWEDIRIKRVLDAAEYDEERTPERLRARELVALSMYESKEKLHATL